MDGTLSFNDAEDPKKKMISDQISKMKLHVSFPFQKCARNKPVYFSTRLIRVIFHLTNGPCEVVFEPCDLSRSEGAGMDHTRTQLWQVTKPIKRCKVTSK